MSHQRGDARKRLTLVPTPCCDAAAKVERVEALARSAKWREESSWSCDITGRPFAASIPLVDLRAALDGPAGGGAG